MDNWCNWLNRRAAARRVAGTAVLASLVTACGTTGGASETTSDTDRFEVGKCFGLDRNISYLAERSSQSGIPVWQHRFTLANSFDFAPATRDARQIAYAVASFDPIVRKLTIRFLSSDGSLIHEVLKPAVAIRQCSEDHTEIFFLRSIRSVEGSVDDRITVNISRINNSARVTAEMDRTQYIVFVPFKRFITYIADFGLQDAGH